MIGRYCVVPAIPTSLQPNLCPRSGHAIDRRRDRPLGAHKLPRAGAARTPVAVGEHGQKRGSTQGLEATKNLYPMSLGRGTAAARAILSGAVEQIPDVQADPEYAIARGASVIGFRSVAAVPMLKEGRPIGAITILRSQAGLLPETQITLLRTFADQAVIAIENARLFEEVQARTPELTEALEQQIVTADVLKVISRSALDLQRVLDALVESAARLTDANDAAVFQVSGDRLRFG